jgi:hypothetical protein
MASRVAAFLSIPPLLLQNAKKNRNGALGFSNVLQSQPLRLRQPLNPLTTMVTILLPGSGLRSSAETACAPMK